MAALEMLERGSFKAGPASGCARGCGGCPLAPSCRPQTGEFAGSIGDLFSKKSQGLREGTFIFSSARQGSGGPPVGTRIETSEKTCSECKKSASACHHSETPKR